MTTTNGGSQARIAEHVDGVVQGANDRGVHLQGEAEWRNYSRWADKPAEAPARGASGRLAIDASGFVRSVELLGAALPSTAPTSRDREIRRMSALRSAAAFSGAKALNTDVSTQD